MQEGTKAQPETRPEPPADRNPTGPVVWRVVESKVYLHTYSGFLCLSSEVLLPLPEEVLWKLDSLWAGTKRSHLTQGKPSDRREGFADSLQIYNHFKGTLPPLGKVSTTGVT